MEWQEKVFDQEIATTLERSTDISPFLAKLLAERNIESVEDAKDFLCPKLAHLHDPFDITNMDRAVGRIKDAIKNKEEVLLLRKLDWQKRPLHAKKHFQRDNYYNYQMSMDCMTSSLQNEPA